LLFWSHYFAALAGAFLAAGFFATAAEGAALAEAFLAGAAFLSAVAGVVVDPDLATDRAWDDLRRSAVFLWRIFFLTRVSTDL
jgi:hypothetical protein